MAEDWTKDPEWQRWVSHVRSELIPALRGSAITMQIVPDGEPDVKIAVELGLSILLDKPIVLLVVPGRKVPERLARAADAIIKADPATGRGQAEIAKFVRERLQAIVGQVG